MQGFVRKIIALLMASLLASWWYTRTASAHGGPVSLTFWGNYGSAVSSCQRAIGQAASVCGLQAVQLRNDCREADLLGTGCDTVATEAGIQTVRAHARSAVRSACSDPEVQTLGYIDRSEALTDVINICRDLDTAAASATFGALSSTSEAAVRPDCIRSTADLTVRLLDVAISSWRTALDRIASTNMSSDAKYARVDHSRQRISGASDSAAAVVLRACGAEGFQLLYGRDVNVHYANVAELADCFGGAVYVQDAVVCPPPECGNGIQEKGEVCDDGNRDPADGCPPECK